MADFVPVNEPLLKGNELTYLRECIETGWISSQGPFVSRLEEELAALVGRKYGIAVCNGSAALDVAVAALGIGPGDEVILPSLTIISCAAAVVRAGATPVVVDSDAATWNMDAAQVEAAVTSRTKAIMAVHTYGLPVDLSPLLKLSKQYDIALIEDAAEAIGLRYNDRPCGGFGEISTFSFYPNKHITTGEGGMVLTDDASTAERCRNLRNLCFGREDRFIHEELGWNFRMSNLQAAVGVAQLERLDTHMALKRDIAGFYNEAFEGIPGLQLPLPQTDYARNCYWVYGLVFDPEKTVSRDRASKELRARGIGTRDFFWPMHEQPALTRRGLFANYSCPTAEYLARNGLYIPSGLGITPENLERVSEAVLSIVT